MLKRIFQNLMPPRQWRLPVLLISGVLVGLVAYLVYVSKAHSYLSDDPKTCVNCHIMAPQYATWTHSSHRQWASCNDCHVPHDNVFHKYLFKAQDGMRHATIFTMRGEPQVIQIRDAGREVVQNNCLRCHDDLIHANQIESRMAGGDLHANRESRQCWDCHREVPHGRVKSLSSVPNAQVPLPESPVPDWLKKMVKTDK